MPLYKRPDFAYHLGMPQWSKRAVAISFLPVAAAAALLAAGSGAATRGLMGNSAAVGGAPDQAGQFGRTRGVAALRTAGDRAARRRVWGVIRPGPISHQASSSRAGLAETISDAARTNRVPRRLLLALGYVNSRFRMPQHPAMDGGVGIMHLPSRGLPRSARLDARQNVRIGAALLASLRPRRASSLAAWYGPVARLGGTVYADEVYDTLARGFSVSVHGETFRVPPTRVAHRGPVSAARADYPAARWFPASPRNYARANRPVSGAITMIVIHVTQGSYGGTVSWFANPAAHVSAHYVVRSMDGEITQTVREKDIAWQAGNSAVNARSIGIEHEAFMSNCAWYTDAMYRSSAQLVAYLAAKYQIPLDRKHIIGHSEVPDPNHPGQYGGADHHTDPGPCWNWSKYMSLVQTFSESSFAATLQRIADDTARSTFSAPHGWQRSASAGAYGRSYVHAKPTAAAGPARFALRIPRAGPYALYAWWPAARSRNSSVPYGIDTSSGRTWLRVDERKGAGWRYLGTFDLARGGTKVLVSRKTQARGTIAADAVKVELLGPRRESRLVSPSEGWTLTGGGLFRTADAGTTWQTALPPGLQAGSIRGVRLSGQSGWIVGADGGQASPLKLFSTSDGGLTWASAPLPVPSDVEVASPVDVQLVEPTRLFVALRLEPNGRSLSRALLLRSDDLGKTWRRLELPEAGRVVFSSNRDGWFVGGLAREHLYVTRDGGTSWKRRDLTPAGAAGAPAYDLPTFTSPEQGVLPISIAAGTSSSLVFDTTTDGGRTWSVAAQLPVKRGIDAGATVPTAIFDPLTWFAAAGGKLIAFKDGGLTRTTVGPLPGAVSTLQFASPTNGWAQVGTCRPGACSVRLFSTADGGVTWARLKLP